jgi:hypothetical protein
LEASLVVAAADTPTIDAHVYHSVPYYSFNASLRIFLFSIYSDAFYSSGDVHKLFPRDIAQSLLTSDAKIPQTGPRHLPFTSLPIHCALPVLSLPAMHCAL